MGTTSSVSCDLILAPEAAVHASNVIISKQKLTLRLAQCAGVCSLGACATGDPKNGLLASMPAMTHSGSSPID